MNKRKTGTAYEKIAADYLKERNIRILAENFRIKQGEVDLIGEDASHLIFIEVKYRSSEQYGYPEEAVSVRKQKRICKVSAYYIAKHPTKKQVRYDVICICGQKITWHQDAFTYYGYS